MTVHILFPILLIFLLVLSTFQLVATLPFVDVTTQAGLITHDEPHKKYGGAMVSDLDGDGWPDLVLCHHDSRRSELYFNNRNGSFTLDNSFRFFQDIHSFTAFHSSPTARGLSFFSSVGGNFGKNPQSPALFRVTASSRAVERRPNIAYGAGRGRSVAVLPLDRRARKWNDIVILNATPNDSNARRNYVATVSTGLNVMSRRLSRLENNRNPYASVTDIDGDGRVELITFPFITMFQITAYFRVYDISDTVFPSDMDRRGVRAIAELDYDNDGRMDLYIARTVTNDLRWMRRQLGTEPDDILLRNVGGSYVDVTATAKIPGGGESTGVTAGDFDNNGWIDLLIQQYDGPDRLLLNFDGVYTLASNPGVSKQGNEVGDHPVAVDYDRDGALDVVLSNGDWFNKEKGGQFRILKNVISRTQTRNSQWLAVRVGSSPNQQVSPLYATVVVSTGGRRRLTRRVGSPGTATSPSYINLLHFGLGGRRWARSVTVRWSDGSTESRRAVRAGQTITFGYIAP